MKNLLNKFSFLLLLTSAFLITACSSSSDSSSGGGSAAVPANAILIDSSAKAESTSISAISTGDSITSVLAVEASAAITATDVLNIALETLRNNQGSTSSATGAAFSDPCTGGGFVSGNETDTGSSYSATATFDSCVEGSITLNGNFSLNATYTSPPGPYTVNASGNLTASFTGGSFGFNGFSFIQSGDESTGAYTTTRFTFAVDPSGGGGYAVQVTQPLVGDESIGCKLSSGQILITGASGSQARATVNSDGSAKIEYHNGDGNFTGTQNSPLPCLI